MGVKVFASFSAPKIAPDSAVSFDFEDLVLALALTLALVVPK